MAAIVAALSFLAVLPPTSLALVFSGPSSQLNGRRLPVMMGVGNSFGRVFRISTFGESHGGGVGVIVDGCPPQMPLTREMVQKELDKRRPGQSRLTTPRNESDSVEILSGLTPDGLTLGTPIGMLVKNKDQRSKDYDEMASAYRPSHADATYDAKYGVRAIAGGGRSSARETIGRVAGGAVAKTVLRLYSGIEIYAYVYQVQDVQIPDDAEFELSEDAIEASIARCPHPETSQRMVERIDKIRRTGNSIGGVVECVAVNVPAGLGSPVFDKLEADLAKACMSLPAAKGFEVGSGFRGVLLTGKEHNDEFCIQDGRTRTKSNRSGGIQGGVSNGESIAVRVAFKPTSTIGQLQDTVTRTGDETQLRGKGRHDPCVLPRAAPMVESMVALTLADALACHVAQCSVLHYPSEWQAGFNQLGIETPHPPGEPPIELLETLSPK